MKNIVSILMLTFIGTAAFAERRTVIEERTQVLQEKILAVGNCRAYESYDYYTSSFQVMKSVTSQKYLVKVVKDFDRFNQETVLSEEMYAPTLTKVIGQVMGSISSVSDKNYEFAMKGCKADLELYQRMNLKKDY
jgi:hypothetical protein